MAQTIKLKRSATAGNTPTTSQLALGELGINTTDGKLFLKKSVSGTESIVDVGDTSGYLPLSGGSLTGSIDVNGSVVADKVTVGTSVVNYSGTDLTVGDNSDSQNGIAIQTSTTGNGYILFGDGSGTSAYNSQIRFDHSTNKMHLRVAGSETLVASTGGIDVTGSVVADGLTVSAPSVTATINATGTNSGLEFTHGSTNTSVRNWSIRSNTEAFGDFIIRRESAYGSGVDTKSMAFASNGDISFYNTAGTSQNLFWDSSTSRLGLGTTVPNTNVQIYNATDDVSINVNHGTGGSYPKKSGISFGAISTALGGDATFTGGAGIQVINTAAANAPTEMLFFTTSGGAPTERF